MVHGFSTCKEGKWQFAKLSTNNYVGKISQTVNILCVGVLSFKIWQYGTDTAGEIEECLYKNKSILLSSNLVLCLCMLRESSVSQVSQLTQMKGIKLWLD